MLILLSTKEKMPTLSAKPAPLWRILAAMLYDALLLIGCIMILGFISVALNGFQPVAAHTWGSHILFIAMILLWISFYVFFWTRQGQTLGMRAWKLLLVGENNRPPKILNAFTRWCIALLTLPLLGLGLWWKSFDSQKQTLYGRLSHTRLVQISHNPYQKRKEKS